VDLARTRRGGGCPDRDLARGPARLATALGVDRAANGTSLVDGVGPVRLSAGAEPVGAEAIRRGPRVGVAAAADIAWRFWVADDPTVSAYRRHVPRRAALVDRENRVPAPPRGRGQSPA
jgi:DNA-3-methyladenine glycosylase